MREVYCPTCHKTHSLPSYDGEKVTPAKVIWESIAFLMILMAIIYGIPVIALWMQARPQ
jgi:hypothetical protein